MFVVSWLIDNMLCNFVIMGKMFSFEFLWWCVGYDILQQLIFYNFDDMYLCVIIVGLLNMLQVVVLGCIVVMVVGVVVGVLCLFLNWLIVWLMIVYVEIFCNIFLLLWIFVIFVIFIEVMLSLNVYCGDNLVVFMLMFDMIVLMNCYIVILMFGMINFFGIIVLGCEGLSWVFIVYVVVIVVVIFVYCMLCCWVKGVQECIGQCLMIWWKLLVFYVVFVLVLIWWFGLYLILLVLCGFNFM